MNDMPRRKESAEEVHGRKCDGGLVVKFDYNWQINGQSEDIRRVYFSLISEPGNATKYDHAVHAMLVAQYVQNLLHERLVMSMISFFQIHPDDDDFGIHLN